MFTGIVEEAGKVVRIISERKSLVLVVESKICARGMKKGDSLAVNGCCLTAVRVLNRSGKRHLYFDLLKETWRLTNFHELTTGKHVNLERALRAGGHLDGHFVTGHIDGCGKVTKLEPHGQDYLLEVQAPAKVMKYVVSKGSIAVDGISLTVAKVLRRRFQIWIIPHTWKVTALRERKIGSAVNLEADILGKYVEAFWERRRNK